MAAACALRALWAAPPRRAPTRGPAAARAATGAHASPSQRGDRDGATNKNRRRHGPHAPDVNLHWRAKNLERSGDRLGALRLLTSARELYPRNAHIGVSAARLVAEDVDGRGADVALDDALAIAQACAEHEPNNPVVANLRATLEARRGGKGAAARARELFARSVELDPTSRGGVPRVGGVRAIERPIRESEKALPRMPTRGPDARGDVAGLGAARGGRQELHGGAEALRGCGGRGRVARAQLAGVG